MIIKADMLATHAFQHGKLMDPREVAKAGIDAAFRGERVIIPGAVNKVAAFDRRIIGESVQGEKNESLSEEMPLEEQKRTREPGEVAAKENSH